MDKMIISMTYNTAAASKADINSQIETSVAIIKQFYPDVAPAICIVAALFFSGPSGRNYTSSEMPRLAGGFSEFEHEFVTDGGTHQTPAAWGTH